MTRKSTHSSSSAGSSDAPSSRKKRQASAAQVRALDAAMERTPVDLDALRKLSVHGFGHDERRKRVWPLLLGVDVAELDKQAAACTAAAAAASSSASSVAAASSSSVAVPSLPAPHDYYSGVIFQHTYFEQIEKDIARSMCHFEGTKRFKDKKRISARAALSRVLHSLFSLHSDLHYVQGFHDIASVFLLVCASPTDCSDPFGIRSNARGEELAFVLTERLALLHLRDSLRPTLDTVVDVMTLIFPLLAETDSLVFEFLRRTHVQSFFSLPWILTWFSHNLEREDDVSRVFDFFLSSHPLIPVYATVALIVELREGLLELKPKAVREAKERYEELYGVESTAAVSSSSAAAPRSSPPPFDPESVEVDLSAVHNYFQHLPPLLDLDSLFARTSLLYQLHPPGQLLRQGGLTSRIPRDSPLLLDAAAKELPDKLTNYLAWKRAQRGRNMQQHGGEGKNGLLGVAAGPLESDGKPLYPSAPASSSSSVAAAATSSSSFVARFFSLLPSFSHLLSMDPSAVAASFYSYPAASSSRLTLLRFALAGRARKWSESWRNRGVAASAGTGRKGRGRASSRASAASSSSSSSVNSSWPRLTRRGQWAVSIFVATAVLLVALYAARSSHTLPPIE